MRGKQDREYLGEKGMNWGVIVKVRAERKCIKKNCKINKSERSILR